MYRLVFAIVFCFCAVSFAVVGFQKVPRPRDAKPEYKPVPREVWQGADSLFTYPTAGLSRKANIVESPYAKGVFVNTAEFSPGQVVMCPRMNSPFYVPYDSSLNYGDIVGSWRISITEGARRTDYEVNFSTRYDQVLGKGRRIRENNRELDPSRQLPIELEGRFVEDELHCIFWEGDGGRDKNAPQRLLQWTLDSRAHVLSGRAVMPNKTFFHSDGEKLTITKANIPTRGGTLEDFVPEDWRLLSQVSSSLPNGHGDFGVLALESKGHPDVRWLVIVVRPPGQSEYATEFISNRIIRTVKNARIGDTFRKLSLNTSAIADPRDGTFVVYHEGGQGYTHTGDEIWFTYDPGRRNWLFAEGYHYQFDTRKRPQAIEIHAYVPSGMIADFDINRLKSAQ